MPDADGSEEIGGQPKNEVPTQPPPGPPTNEDPPTESAEDNPGDNQTTATKLEQIAHGERWLIGIGILTILVNVVLGWIYYQQLTEMRAATEASTRAVDLAQYTLQYNASQFDRGMQQTISQTVSQYRAAEEATVAANAAKNAADTAKDALHISESAYITTTSPQIDGVVIKIGVVNSGHLASGHTQVVWYEATSTSLSSPTGRTPTDYRFMTGAWGSGEVTSVPPGGDGTIRMNDPMMSLGNVQNGTMHITVAGMITYNDGFPNTPNKQWPFCFETFYQFTTTWVTCNYEKVVPEVKADIKYPQNRHD